MQQLFFLCVCICFIALERRFGGLMYWTSIFIYIKIYGVQENHRQLTFWSLFPLWVSLNSMRKASNMKWWFSFKGSQTSTGYILDFTDSWNYSTVCSAQLTEWLYWHAVFLGLINYGMNICEKPSYFGSTLWVHFNIF